MKLNNNDDSHNSGLNLLIYNMLLDIESHPTWVCGLKRHDIYYICLIKSYQVMKLNRIKTVLSEKGISQTWLAKQLDKSFSMVNAYACNRIQPNLETLQRIAEILQVDLKDLITDKKERLQ